MAWAGWDPDAPRRNHGLTIRIPALIGEQAEMRDEFVSATRGPVLERFRLSYNAVVTAPATLTRRHGPGDTPEELHARIQVAEHELYPSWTGSVGSQP